jgi:hypothetical protein
MEKYGHTVWHQSVIPEEQLYLAGIIHDFTPVFRNYGTLNFSLDKLYSYNILIMNKFIDPAWYSNSLRECKFPGYPDRTNSEYTSHFEAIDSKYNNKSPLPVGTILYRGTHIKDYNPRTVFTADHIFLGLDYIISAWILLEGWINYNKTLIKPLTSIPENTYGYIHVFKLKKNLEYEYILADGCTPLNVPHFKYCKEKACVHPQILFHEGFKGDNSHIELGTELTIPKSFADEYLHYIGTHTLSINELFKNKGKPFYKWHPKNSIKSIQKGDAQYILYKGRTHKINLGKRGGKYIKINNNLVYIKSLNINA